MKLLNSLFFLVFCVQLSLELSAQTNAVLPRHESRDFFALEPYPMGFDKDSMQMIFSFLDRQQKISWKRKDSLDFFFSLVATDQFDDALALIKRVHNFEPRNLEELHLTQYLYSYKRRYDRLNFWLDYEYENFPDSRLYIPYRRRIYQVENHILSKNWNSDDSTVYPELIDSKWRNVRRGDEVYQLELIPLVKRIDQALRTETKYEFKSNIALALGFYEFGRFLKEHVSITDAFIALAIARYYDKFNPDINEQFRVVRSSMNKNRYIFPSIRVYFPKQSKGYFNIEMIRKRREAAQKVVVEREENPEMLRRQEVKSREIIQEEHAFWIIFGGLLILLFFVLFFVKIKV